MRRDQVFDLLALANNVDRDAYRAKTVQLSALIERQSNIIWRKKWTWSYGVDLIATDERGIFDDLNNKETRTFLIAAAPVSLRYDGSNDLLDPTKGFRLGGRISPEISGAWRAIHLRPGPDRRERLPPGRPAAWSWPVACVSEPSSAPRHPRSRLRGVSSPAAADRFADTGTSSLARATGSATRSEAGAWPNSRSEARVRLKAFGGNFGVVPFIDGGTLSSDITPDFGKWQLGAGIGAPLLFELRPDPRRCWHAAQSALGRCAGRRRRFAGAGLLDDRNGRQRSQRAATPSAAARLGEAAGDRARHLFRGVAGARGHWPYRARYWPPGHRFIVDRLQQIETSSGLRFRIGRIEGLYLRRDATEECRCSRPARRIPDFAEIDVDWTPGAWFRNSLYRRTGRGRSSHAPSASGAQEDGQVGPDPAQVRYSHWRSENPPAGARAGGYGRGSNGTGPRQGGHSIGQGRSSTCGWRWIATATGWRCCSMRSPTATSSTSRSDRIHLPTA